MGDADIQKLIKKVIELTRCSPAQAELALYDNDNNIPAAVDYIFDQGADIESWTEHKTRKDKKKEEEERAKPIRGQQPGRVRGSTSDRGGRGRGGSTSTPRGAASRGGGTSRGGRGQSARPQQQRSKDEKTESNVLKAVDLNEGSSDWKNGPLEFKRSESVTVPQAVPSSSNSAAPVTNSSPAPISFAAVAAAAARREQQKNLPPVVQNLPSEPPRVPTPEPIVESVEDNFIPEPSVAHPHLEEEEIPVNHEEPVNVVSVHNVQATSPQLQANVTWTTQLKSDLGIPISTDVSPVKPQHFPNQGAGVEFATEAVPTGLVDYHFGFVDAPSSIPQGLEQPPTHTAESLFANARHSAATVSPMKPSPELHSAIGNGEYTREILRASPPVVSAANAIPQNRLGFADASTVSFNSAAADARAGQNVTKPLGHTMPPTTQPQPLQPHQPQQQQQQQQQMFPSQMPFSYPNPYNMLPSMYSPVTAGIRPEDYSALLQYPFTVPGMDMANLMGTGGFPQSSNNQSLSNQHRTDNHGIDNTMKFSSQNNRDQNQQPSGVQPPPGFGTSHFSMQPQMSMLQHQYTQQHPYAQFMMPNIGNVGGRQIYSPDEDNRKTFDKIGGAKPQTAQPQGNYHNGSHYGMTNQKKYNWAP